MARRLLPFSGGVLLPGLESVFVFEDGARVWRLRLGTAYIFCNFTSCRCVMESPIGAIISPKALSSNSHNVTCVYIYTCTCAWFFYYSIFCSKHIKVTYYKISVCLFCCFLLTRICFQLKKVPDLVTSAAAQAASSAAETAQKTADAKVNTFI